MKKKQYTRPELIRIILDYSVSIRMLSGPIDPPPHGGGSNKKSNEPFESPFGDKPFS